MNIKNPSWLMVALEWLFLVAAPFGMIFWSFTIYSFDGLGSQTTPVFDRIFEIAFNIAFPACLLVGVVLAIPVLVFGSWGKRVVGVPPLLVFIIIIVTIIGSWIH